MQTKCVNKSVRKGKKRKGKLANIVIYCYYFVPGQNGHENVRI